MRLLITALVNLWILVWALLALPLRAWRARRRPAYVRFRIEGDPPYRSGLSGRWGWRRQAGGARVRSLEELGRQLEVLAGDDKVKGILLDVESLELPPAKLTALHALLADFRARGKRVVGRAVVAGNSEYELLCAADEVILPRAGRVELTGFSVEAMAVGDALQRIGVTPQFIRRGDYKTAPELFTHAAVTPAQREMLGLLLDERYERLRGRLEKGRRLSAEEAAKAIDEGPYSARRAIGARLCDALVEDTDLATHLSPGPGRPGEGGGRELPDFRAYARARVFRPHAFRSLRRRPRIAVVPLSGLIAQGDGGSVPIVQTAVCGSESAVRALRAAGRDSRSVAALLYISSPGGSALASEIILEEVRRLALRKPVVAYVDRVAASGGYLVAMGARELWTDPHALVGSIGVYAGKFDFSRLLERLGVRREVLARGQHAARFSLSRPFSPSEEGALEAEVEEIYRDFLATVAEARKKTVEEIRVHAEGRVFSGQRALAAGLVDRLGGFEEAARRAMELAELPGRRFDLALHRPAGRGLGLVRLLAQAARSQVYALWGPGVFVPGLQGSEPF